MVKILAPRPILKVVIYMSTKNATRQSEFETAATARWLAAALGPARARVKTSPSAAAIDRMRARVLGPEAAKRHKQRIAA